MVSQRLENNASQGRNPAPAADSSTKEVPQTQRARELGVRREKRREPERGSAWAGSSADADMGLGF